MTKEELKVKCQHWVAQHRQLSEEAMTEALELFINRLGVTPRSNAPPIGSRSPKLSLKGTKLKWAK